MKKKLPKRTFFQHFRYRMFFILFVLLPGQILTSTAQPSATNIPNPYTNTDIIPSTANKLSLYGVSGNFTGVSAQVSDGGAITVAPYGGEAGFYIEDTIAWQSGGLVFSTACDADSYDYLYFVCSNISRTYLIAEGSNGWVNQADNTVSYSIPGCDDWKLYVVDISGWSSNISKILFMTNLPTGYVANVCLADQGYTPPVVSVPEPTALIEPQHTDIHSIFSDNINGNNIASVAKWSSFVAEPYQLGSKNAYKVSWPSDMTNYTGAVLFNLTSDASVSASSLASDYTHLHVDVWSSTAFAEGYLRLSLRDESGNIADVNTYSKKLGAINAELWTSYDIPLSTLLPSDNIKTLQTILFQRLTVPGEGLIYIDNIYLYSTANDGPKTPSLSPPSLTSLWGANKVTSIFSDEYTNENINLTFTPSKEDFLVENNKNYSTWKFANSTNVSITGNINVSGKNKFHIDVWTEQIERFQIKLNDSYVYPSDGYYTTLGDNWYTIDVDMPNAITSINKIEIIGSETTTYYVDNIYFYNDIITAQNIPIFQANDSLGRGINLGNAFEDNGYGSSGNAFSVSIAKNLIDKIATINQVAESGNKFDHIRIPVRWDYDDRLTTTEPYIINPTFFNEVKEVVDYALSKDLKVILNVHHFNPLYAAAGGSNYAYEKARFFAIWEQICNRFGYYDHNLFFEILNEPRNPMTYTLWNELIPEALSVIRGSGKNNIMRPTLVATANWGGFPHLDQLVWPTGDDHLIATVHIYSPNYLFSGYNQSQDTKIEWWDTENEREMIRSFVDVGVRFQETHPNVPIHVGEFGVYKYVDVDSRVLTLTHSRNLFEEKGFSWAYWEFRAGYGIYDATTQTYNVPVVNALLSNETPETPAAHTIQSSGNIAYSIENNGTSDWKNINGSLSNNGVYKTFEKGTYWGPSFNNLYLAQDKATTYRVSFKASATKEDKHYLATMSRISASNEYTTLISFMISPVSEEKEYAYTFTIPQNSDKVQFSITASTIIEESGVTNTLNITDFIIEEVEKRHEAAPIPTLSNDKVNAIFSTYYPNSKSISFSGSGIPTYAKDNSNETGNEIIQIADFTNQSIHFSSLNIETQKTLRLQVYAGSQMKGMSVKVSGTGGIVTKTVDLPSHEWQVIELDLGNMTHISDIELSGGTGTGRKLFLDHIYIFDPNVTPSEPKIEEVYNSTSDKNIKDNWRLRDTSGRFNQVILGKEDIKIALAENIEEQFATKLITKGTIGFNSGDTYIIRFTASANQSSATYKLYLIDKTTGTHYLVDSFSPTSIEQEFSFTYKPNVNINAQIAVVLGGQINEDVVLLSFKDIVIERIKD